MVKVHVAKFFYVIARGVELKVLPSGDHYVLNYVNVVAWQRVKKVGIELTNSVMPVGCSNH